MAFNKSTNGSLKLIKINPVTENESLSTVMVFGGLGFIGHTIVAKLLRLNKRVIVVDIISDYSGVFNPNELTLVSKLRLKRISGAEVHYIDVNNTLAINDLVYKYKPDEIIHLSAFPSAKTVNSNPVLATETMTTSLVNIARLAKEVGSHFTFFSSSMVYGEWTSDVMDETCNTNPNSLYGILKYSGELILKNMLDNNKLLIVRPSGAYGPYDITDRVVSRMFASAMNNEVIKVHGADTKLDFTYIDDLADAVAYGVSNRVSGVYNISSGIGTSLIELAQKVKEITESTSFLSISERNALYPNRGKLDHSLAAKHLNYTPQFTLELGLVAYYRWLLADKFPQLAPVRPA